MSPARDTLVGRTLGGRYLIQRKLGQGGMGAVYLAENTNLGKRVALKVLSSHIAGRADLAERFRREARSAAALDHPNIVRVYDFGQDDGLAWFIMEFVEGESLQDRIKREKRLDPIEALRITREVARGLDVAHRAGLIHRDIKPDNIMLSKHGGVLIADFGLAKDLSDSAEPALTATGAILGTPYYMSPEQCEGLSDIDARTDLFSLGLVLYTLLTGQIPAEGETPLRIIHNRIARDPAPPLDLVPELDPGINDLVLDLLVRDRDARLGPAAALVTRIDALLGGQSELQSARTVVAAASATTAPAKPVGATAIAPGAAATTQLAPGEAAPLPGAAPPASDQGRSALSWLAPLIVIAAGIGISLLALQPDRTPLDVKVSALPRWTRETGLTLSGEVSRPTARVTLATRSGQVIVPLDDKGRFEQPLTLQPGFNRIRVVAENPPARPFVLEADVTVDTARPVIRIDGLEDKSDRVTLTGGKVQLSGRVRDEGPVELTVGDRPTPVSRKEANRGAFQLELTPATGLETLTLVARDEAGNTATRTLKLVRAAAKPARFVALEAPDPAIVSTRTVTLTGRLDRPGEVRCGTTSVRTDDAGRFTVELPVQPGANALTLEGHVDGVQAPARRELSILCDDAAPKVLVEGEPGAPEHTADGRLLGRVLDDSQARLRVESPKLETPDIALDDAGAFAIALPEGTTSLVLVATDAAGNRTRRALNALDETASKDKPADPPKDKPDETPTTDKPAFRLTLLEPGPIWTMRRTLTIKGIANRLGASVRALGEPVKVDSAGRFTLVVPLAEGENTIPVTATTEAGETTSERVIARLDSTPPALVVPEEGARPGPDGVIALIIQERHLASVTVDGRRLTLEPGAAPGFTPTEAQRAAGKVTVVLTDRAGNTTPIVLPLVLPTEPKRDPAASAAAARVEASRWGILADRGAWQAADSAAREAVAKQVGEALGDDYEPLGLKRYSCGKLSHDIARFRHKSTGIELHLIPGGVFTFGDPSDDADSFARPAVKLTLEPFLIGRSEVTQRQWDTHRTTNARHFKNLQTAPMEGVSWEDCTTWLGKAGGGLRLPSESEWEFACRAGSTTTYFWGDDFDPSYVWHGANARKSFGINAGTRPGFVNEHDSRFNAFGLQDMLGNVKEWCADDWLRSLAPPPVGNAPRRYPAGEEPSRPEKAVRGGSYMNPRNSVTVVSRLGIDPGSRFRDRGFRVARSLP